MTEFLSHTLQFMILLPGMLLAYLPMKQYLRMPPARLAILTLPLTIFLCLADGALSCFFSVSPTWLFFPTAVIACTFYVRTLKITRWKSISVFLAICVSCIGSVAVAISGILSPEAPAPPLSLNAAIFWLLMRCAFVAVSWYPARHATICVTILILCQASPGRKSGKVLRNTFPMCRVVCRIQDLTCAKIQPQTVSQAITVCCTVNMTSLFLLDSTCPAIFRYRRLICVL